MRVNLIGLGRMGAAYAQRLAEAGHAVGGHDVTPAAARALAEVGVTPLASVSDAVADGVPILLSLPNAEVVGGVVAEVMTSVGEVRPLGVVDLSTSGAVAARSVAQSLGALGVPYAEAPVTGGVAGARNGSLTLMAAGDGRLLDAVAPVLNVLGDVVRVGDRPGLGQAMKVLNNLLSATNLAITSEALAAGTAFGLDPAQMLAVFNAGSGRNAATEEKFPKYVLSGSFDQGFATSLMTKDVLLAQDLLHDVGAPAWVAAAVVETWVASARVLGGDTDFTEIARFHARNLFDGALSGPDIYEVEND
jgi:3-hydroxyisobutyrate dehydrogenase